MRTIRAVPILCLCAGVTLAQSGPSYRLEESTLNAGGHPGGGLSLASANYRMSLDAVGEAPVAPLLQGSVYSMDAGFARCYPPPGEVRDVYALADKITFAWAPDPSVGTYRIYGGEVQDLTFDRGTCLLSEVAPEFATLEQVPDPGRTIFYLITAENTLLEEGSIGYDGAGALRSDPVPCP